MCYITLAQTIYVQGIYYQPLTKLREGNVFSCVYLSATLSREGVSYVTITHNAMELTIQRPPPLPQGA